MTTRKPHRPAAPSRVKVAAGAKGVASREAAGERDAVVGAAVAKDAEIAVAAKVVVADEVAVVVARVVDRKDAAAIEVEILPAAVMTHDTIVLHAGTKKSGVQRSSLPHEKQHNLSIGTMSLGILRSSNPVR